MLHVVPLSAGFVLAYFRFPGRWIAISLLNSLLAVPTVVVGLVLYMLLSRAGPLGEQSHNHTTTHYYDNCQSYSLLYCLLHDNRTTAQQPHITMTIANRIAYCIAYYMTTAQPHNRTLL